jgi:SAM-dependent methyltransferase
MCDKDDDTTSNNPNCTMAASQDGGSAMIRRRDKRRHVSSSSVDLRDPFSVIGLAIRFDESFGDESVLTIPLETGRIYNQKSFAKALLYLQKRTAPPRQLLLATSGGGPSNNANSSSTLLITKKQQNKSKEPVKEQEQEQQQQQEKPSPPPPPKQQSLALTPIILSGLLSAIQEQQEKQHLQQQSMLQLPLQDEDEDAASITKSTVDEQQQQQQQQQQLLLLHQQQQEQEPKLHTSSELVAYCQSMRRAALSRVKLRNQRRRIQQTITPLLLMGSILIFYWWTMSGLRHLLIELGYVDSCLVGEGETSTSSSSTSKSSHEYQRACRLSEANLWERVHPQRSHHQYHHLLLHQGGECTLDECLLVEGHQDQQQPFYAMHTTLKEEFIPIEKVAVDETRQRQRQRISSRSRTRTPHHTATPKRTPLQWLGETTLNRMVRQILEQHHTTSTSSSSSTKTDPMQLLDIGCGVGGTMYALLPPPGATAGTTGASTTHGRQLVYRGIAISLAEVRQAERLASVHALNESVMYDIQFATQSFDTALNNLNANVAFTAMVAIESLSYSNDLGATLSNLALSLKRGGIMIVVEDVVAPWAAGSNSIQHLSNVTARSSLVTHEEWKTQFELNGFKIQQVRDLGLEYDLVDLQQLPPYGWIWETLAEWRRRPSQFVLEKWEAWLGPPPRDNNETVVVNPNSSRKIIHLLQNLVQSEWGSSLRRQAHRNAELSYYMYICTKK